MSDMPPDLLSEILSRVPAQPLLRFRCVCKAWRHIIDDPAFSKLQRCRHRFITTGDDQLILRSNESTKLYFLPLGSLRGKRRVAAVNRPQFSRPGSPRLCGFPVASCDGMILLSHSKVDKAWTLWNPFNGEFFALPLYDDLTDVRDGGRCLNGLGYDCVTDDYKIVRIAGFDGTRNLEILVYSLKLGCWRRIKDFTGCQIPIRTRYYSELCCGVFANGALYWMVDVEHQGKNVQHIMVFDLGTEDCCLLPLPPAILEEDLLLLTKREHVSQSDLCVLNDCLFLRSTYFVNRMDLWKMENYGGKSSWVKLFSCRKHQLGSSFADLRPIAYLESKGQVLLKLDYGDFFWFHVKKNFARKVSMSSSYEGRSFSSQLCPPSLFHLCNCHGVDVSGGAKGKAGRKKNTANERLKLKVKYHV